MNEVKLLGFLGADPDLKFGPSGTAICNLRVATSEKWKDKDGNKQERTEWHRVTVFGPAAENCSKYLAKGRQVLVMGKLRTRSWEKDGVRHYSTDIIAAPSGIQFLGKKPSEVSAPIETQSDVTDEMDVPL